ncbi:PIN domain-containing protein [Rubrobacter marinus]|uniref:Ribonuclease VapC n=1 Tax=Rubrobacter marinus TaxID=2653852 RepID=A0A6G8PUP9_9ACTN|nr:type II toxin-antitoxin system VapC family toxin [Rubrobacter marinus]QIN77952.1 PIN domain-containing protein [Rubrobacter marinus]
MILLLDTNICIYLIRGRPPEALRRFEGYAVGEIGVSSITVAELHFGVSKSRQPEKNRQALEQFLLALEIVGFDGNAAVAYGRIRAELEAKGTPIGPLDTLIAAQAIALDSTLVTNNIGEFSRVPGLEVEDWSSV